jgi:flagellar biosynthetic protein FliO
MVGSRKKMVVFLVTTVIGCGALVLCSAGSGADKTEQLNSETKSESLFERESSLLSKKDNGPGTRELFFKFMVSVLFLAALAAGGIYISKRLLPNISNLSGKEIKIIETVHLGPRKSVHLLEIGRRRMLIGSTNENITRLADLTEAFSELQELQMKNV